MDILKRLDEILKSCGMGRRELALLSGISPSTLQTAFTRQGAISVSNLLKICDTLDLSPNDLLGVTIKGSTFGTRMASARKIKGYTQETLADILGMSTGSVQQYELNKRRPNIDMLKKICTCLEVTPNEMLNMGSE